MQSDETNNGREQRPEIDYSFAVTTYNSEKTVIATLESIRYQIEKYGRDYKIQLIISDDASTDNTQRYCDIWLEENGYLFCDIVKNYSEENRGVCSNYCAGIKSVKGKTFREIAGDDLMSPNNIFRIMDLTEEYDIVAANILMQHEGKIISSYDDYRIVIIENFYNRRILRTLSKLDCPLFCGHLQNKKTFDDSVYEFIMRFRNIEDRPYWYYVFNKKRGSISYTFLKEPSMIYRVSPNSLSHQKKGETAKQTELDMEKLRKIAMLDGFNLFEKLCFVSGKINKKVNLLNAFYYFLMLVHGKQMKRIYNAYILESLKEGQEFLDAMEQRNKAFLKRYATL